MVANLLATLMIIAIHYNSRGAIDTSSGFGWNYLLQEFFVNGVARSAVPLFALLSGFFIANKVGSVSEYRQLLVGKWRQLLMPYLLASLLIFVSTTLLKYLLRPADLPSLTPLDVAFDVVVNPVSSQFWYLRDLMVLVVVSPILFNLSRVISRGLVTLVGTLWLFDIQPFPMLGDWYCLNIETLFFFWLGGLLCQTGGLNERLIESRRSVILCVLALWLGLVAIRVTLDPTLDVWYVRHYSTVSILLYKAAIALGVVSIIQLSARVRGNTVLIRLSGLTFFVYLFHLAPLSYLKYVTGAFTDAPLAFYVNFPLATALVFVIAYLMSNWTGGLYAVLTGGRSPAKALARLS